MGLDACQTIGLVTWIDSVSASVNQLENDSVTKQYLSVFLGVGLLHNHVYTIRMKEGVVPYSVSAPRRVKIPLLPKLKVELERMQRLDIIKEVTEPTDWVSPMVPVLKKNGQIRVCVDLSELNKAIKRVRFQIPVAEEIFARMKGAVFFAVLDATSGFWQIPLREGSSLLTTFITPFGRFRFTRLPFGITSGPEVFQRVMQQMLIEVEGVDFFIDDIVVWGETVEQHDQRLKQVLEKCKMNGLTLNGNKCQLRSKKVNFLVTFCQVMD